MKILVLVVLVLAAAILLLVKRPKADKSSATAAQAKRAVKAKASANRPFNRYKSTSIVFADTACDAVKAIGSRHFLDADRNVPKLPLADCTVSGCTCKYAHHDDRREISEDRRHPSGLQAELYDRGGAVNRREKRRGRRKSDWA